LLPGSTWVEGLGDSDGHTSDALAGEPTWNQRLYGSTAWGTAGATGATDIDLATTKTYNLTGGTAAFMTCDITTFVQNWANGTWVNNGMLMWGGESGSSAYWFEYSSETSTVANRPYLTINYTPAPVPEPGSLLALGTMGVAALGFMRRRRA
jgi:hypothetical protein